MQLLTTEVNSPIRIENSKKNRNYIAKQLSSKTMKGINLKFSTIASILSTQVDTIRLGLQMAATLLLIIFLVSLIVSAFVCVLYFTTNKMTLSIQRALGINLVDRYRKVIAAWLFVYLIQIIVATVFSHSIVGLGAGVLLALIDILISLSIFIIKKVKIS